MATATKAPAKRAASKTSAAAAVKSTRAKNGSAAQASAGAAKATGKPGSSVRKTTPARALNGADAQASASRVTRLAKPARATRGSRSKGESGSSVNGVSGVNGALPAELHDDAQELARDALHDGEVVRKSRALNDDSDAAVPVQVGGLTPEVTRPAYWDKACADLVKRDRILKKLIPKFGPVHLMSRGDPFVTLARSVVGQQISVASAQAAWQRVESACPKLVPQQFIKLGQDKLMACGLSKRKAEYILDLAEHFVSGALHVGKWTSMDDEAVIAELTQIRGIGRWTAEMFLIFNLSRPDVLPLDDLGLIRAISVNYFSGEPVTRSEAREVAANWEPWRTVATWYMWRSLDPLPVDY
jgi:DNA-3-methyladenine glycosylase II